jgi:hypothetical protein
LKLKEIDLGRKFHFLLHRQKYRTPGIDAFLRLCREVSSNAERSDQIVFPRSSREGESVSASPATAKAPASFRSRKLRSSV